MIIRSSVYLPSEERQFSSVHLLSHVWLFWASWTAAHQASLSITNSRVYSNSCALSWWFHPTISSSIISFSTHLQSFPASGFFQKSVLHIRWPKYWSFSFSIIPSNEYSEFISLGLTSWISLQSKGLSRVFTNTTVQKYQFFSAQLFYSPTLTSTHDYWKNHSFD